MLCRAIAGNKTVSSAPAKSLTLNVAFSFAEAWEIGPAGSLNSFPPGGGGLGLRDIVIAPVNLAGKTAAEIAHIQARRASDIALVAQAIAAAETQFVSALKALES